MHPIGVLTVVVLVAGRSLPATSAAEPKSAKDLAGLWQAKRRFGPELRGPLTLRQSAAGWRAEIVGRSTPAKVTDDTITFEFADHKGTFKGKFADHRANIAGHWFQPTQVENGAAYASPAVLTLHGKGLWRGEVSPLDDEMTLYLMIKPARTVGSMRSCATQSGMPVGFSVMRG